MNPEIEKMSNEELVQTLLKRMIIGSDKKFSMEELREAVLSRMKQKCRYMCLENYRPILMRTCCNKIITVEPFIFDTFQEAKDHMNKFLRQAGWGTFSPDNPAVHEDEYGNIIEIREIQ